MRESIYDLSWNSFFAPIAVSTKNQKPDPETDIIGRTGDLESTVNVYVLAVSQH